MVNPLRYNFYTIFDYNATTGLLSPKYTINVNGVRYQKFFPIPPGLTFGGINLYYYIGKDIAGIWDSVSNELKFMGFYPN